MSKCDTECCFNFNGECSFACRNRINQEIRTEVIDEVKTSLKQVKYEYDNEMSVDNNIGSAMLGEFAKGYNDGYASKCTKIRAEAYDELSKAIKTNWLFRGKDGKPYRETIDEIIEELKEKTNERL